MLALARPSVNEVWPLAANQNHRFNRPANDNNITSGLCTRTKYYYDSLARVSQRWAAETQEAFGYDGLGRLTSYNTPLGNFTFAYQGQTGRVTSKSVNGGTLLSQTYGYDTVAHDRRLLTITASTTAARSYTLGYTYNSGANTDRFNIRTIAESVAPHPIGAQTWAYSYDQSDRLLSAVGTLVSGSTLTGGTSAGTFGWQLDKLDNPTKISYPGYNDFPLYNQHNQQTKNSWWQSFSFDPSGNSTREYNENNITQRDYKWDFEGRLVEMGNGSTNYKVEFRYDGFGRRILQKTTDGSTVTYKRYQWCGMRPCQLRPASGTSRTRSYLLTGEYDFTQSKKYVYFTDHQGNVRDLLDGTTGTRVGALDYTPYGTLRNSFGTLPDFRYAGLLWVPEMGLYASSTRFYDPGTTRWLNRDWIREAGGINMYAYVGANPIMNVDPLGTIPGEENGTRFETIEEAACDAIAYINPTSIIDNLEYGGTIRRDPNPKDPSKPFYATTPIHGLEKTVTVPVDNSRDVSMYHTHGDYSRYHPEDAGLPENLRRVIRTDRLHDEFNSNNFSPGDRIQAAVNASLIPGWISFLGIPLGGAKKYDPKNPNGSPYCNCGAKAQ